MNRTGVTRKEKIDAISAWMATPEDLRPVPTLRQLALSIGAPADGGFYKLAESHEVARQVMGVSATIMLSEVPAILGQLVEQARKGNIRAAEVFLTQVRLMITSVADKVPTRSQANAQELIGQTSQAAAQLLQHAQALGPAAGTIATDQ